MELVATTSDAFNKLKQCRHGQMLYNINDQYIGRSLDLYGEFSEGEIDLFKQLGKPGQVIVEVGSNVGAHTVSLAQLVGITGRVLAFEPQRLVFQTLCANLALNNIVNVLAFQQAVGSAPGEIVVPLLDWRREQNFGGLALGQYSEGERVPVVTIDSFNLQRCDFIKVDVEGMEMDVLKGATQTIARTRPFLYVENDRREKAAELVRYIDSLGYDMFWHAAPLYNPDNFRQNAENVFGQIVSLNMFCVHKSQPHKMQGFQKVELPTEGTTPSP
jgi:FkbM family methyltransferase